MTCNIDDFELAKGEAMRSHAGVVPLFEQFIQRLRNLDNVSDLSYVVDCFENELNKLTRESNIDG